METETIDRLFLELSQFTNAKTRRELELEDEVKTLSAAALSKGWTQGFACAAALVMRTHHEDVAVRDVVSGSIPHGEAGLRAAFAADGAAEYDLEAIDKAYQSGSEHHHRQWFGARAKGGG